MYKYTYSRSEPDPDPVLKDVAFNRHSMNVADDHTSPDVLQQSKVLVGADELSVQLIQGINEEDFKLVTSIGTVATTGVDPMTVEDGDVLWEEMLKGGLQTALETQTVVFLVTGASRALTHQLVRTRKASFHQQSQRATYMGDGPNIRMPESVFRNDDVRLAFLDAIEAAEKAYQMACEYDIAYQDARYILPEGCATQIMCEYPLREFLNMYAYRACYMFLWEHVVVVREMGRLLVEAHPWLGPYVKISCEKSKRCTFMGWEAVDEQCEFEWGREDNRNYRPAAALRIV